MSDHSRRCGSARDKNAAEEEEEPERGGDHHPDAESAELSEVPKGQPSHRRYRAQPRRPASPNPGDATTVYAVLCGSSIRTDPCLTVATPVPMTAYRVRPSQGRPKAGSIDFSV